mgnify:CR=1 FL=1
MPIYKPHTIAMCGMPLRAIPSHGSMWGFPHIAALRLVRLTLFYSLCTQYGSPHGWRGTVR